VLRTKLLDKPVPASNDHRHRPMTIVNSTSLEYFRNQKRIQSDWIMLWVTGMNKN